MPSTARYDGSGMSGLDFMWREVALDTNAMVNLLENFSAADIATALRSRFLRLAVPEMSLVQVYSWHRAEDCYRRFCKMVDLARIAPDLFYIGAPMYRIFQEELSGRRVPSTPCFTNEYLQEWYSNGASREMFNEWHEYHRSEARYLDPLGWLGTDAEARKKVLGLAPELESQRVAAATVKQWFEHLPQSIFTDDGWALQSLVRDARQRARVLRNPKRHPFTAVLALACMLNMIAAMAELKGHHEFGYLFGERDNWTDARILSSAAYADIFVTEDRNLTKKAALLRGWGFLRPEVKSVGEVFGL